ncbi:alpha/beta hydrolase [Tamaricihabitans halophyticus]|uniref:alpha/beta hydrolase n=1 Tax=Tamaricihabitans halophyticus TaxID=1262583 RepID=UPI0014055C87|nr:alpha/beta hydrolase [Tamaricihabitans halophyticus]
MTGSATQVQLAAKTSALDWKPCADTPDDERLACARLTVPVDWADPAGDTMELAVVRRVPKDAGASKGALVYLPAGPGSSGVDTLASDGLINKMFSQAVQENFELISIDPRGTQRSSGVTCSARLAGELDTPDSAKRFDDMLAANAELGADCRNRTGPVFDHLDSTNTARDIELLRTELDEDKLSFYGLSYGTVYGQMYAELFGSRIRAMVLDANVDHSVSAEQATVSAVRAGQRSFDEFVAWCAEDKTCALRGDDVRETVAQLFDRAERGELADPDDPTRRLTENDVASAIIAPLTKPAVQETADAIARLAGRSAKPRGETGAVDGGASEPGVPETVPVPIAIYCADFAMDVPSYADYARIHARAAATAPDTRVSPHTPPWLCLNWPAETTNPQHRLDAPDAPPIVVLNSRFDASTPHEGAANVAEQLASGVLVTYEGMGHGAANRTVCVTNVLDEYYLNLAAPRDGTSCPAAKLG